MNTLPYSSETAGRLCRLAQLAYRSRATARAGGRRMGLSLAKASWRNQGATHAAVWEDEKAVCLAFCGTNDWTDMLTNISVLPLPHAWGRVHGGFLGALRRVDEEILAFIAGMMRARERELWITGHSLGGALAVLMAARLQEAELDVSGVYTFGQPKTGDKDFKQHYNRVLGDRTWRVVYRNDPVPRWMGAIFRHTDTYHGLGEGTPCQPAHPGKTGPQRYGKSKVTHFADHKIATYCAELAREAKCALEGG